MIEEKVLLTTGVWKVMEWANGYVVVEIYPHAAFGYLWDKDRGIRSHVWLFNCDAAIGPDQEQDQHITPPPMSPENIVLSLPIPSSIDDISCVFNLSDNTWDLHWSGQKLASLADGSDPGFSACVLNANELAQPYERSA